jgi:hypothetical protein
VIGYASIARNNTLFLFARSLRPRSLLVPCLEEEREEEEKERRGLPADMIPTSRFFSKCRQETTGAFLV